MRRLQFAAVLPLLRQKVAADMKREGLPREKVLATIVSLLEKTLIRVGNADYAANKPITRPTISLMASATDFFKVWQASGF